MANTIANEIANQFDNDGQQFDNDAGLFLPDVCSHRAAKITGGEGHPIVYHFEDGSAIVDMVDGWDTMEGFLAAGGVL